jgi:Asp-tRNA(Asn)/Glu-tRNA(Gln) amidotransferase C subunit
MNRAITTLFHEVERLDTHSLDVFIDSLISLRVRRDVPKQQKDEALLLAKINKSLPLIQVERFRFLNTKRLENQLTTEENEELLSLLEKTEKLNANRIKHLATLARLRNVSIRELMKQLNIRPQNG